MIFSFIFRDSNDSDDNLAIPYYKMARVTPPDVLKRVKKVQEQSGNHVSEYLFILL